MIQSIYISQNGSQRESLTLEEIRSVVEEKTGLLWVNVASP